MKPYLFTKEEIQEQLILSEKILNKIPSSLWWVNNSKKYNFVSLTTIRRYFGTWQNAVSTSFKTHKKYMFHESLELNCTQCGKSFIKLYCQYIRSKNHFCSRSCSVTYNNTHKTKGNRRSKLEIWLELKLKEKYSNLEILFNDKTAINSELDIYIPSLQLAFEINGIFHYEPIYGQDKLDKIQVNDNNKFMLCHQNNISLCIIDTSSLKHFKEHNAMKFLNIITDIIDKSSR